MPQVTTNKQFSLNLPDWLKGLLMAIGTPVIAVIIDSTSKGSLNFDWKLIATTAISAGGLYLMKNFLTPTHTVISGDVNVQIQQPNNSPNKN